RSPPEPLHAFLRVFVALLGPLGAARAARGHTPGFRERKANSRFNTSEQPFQHKGTKDRTRQGHEGQPREQATQGLLGFYLIWLPFVVLAVLPLCLCVETAVRLLLPVLLPPHLGVPGHRP